ncbi:conserved exported protein of unknown function [Pararobbsia alpina]
MSTQRTVFSTACAAAIAGASLMLSVQPAFAQNQDAMQKLAATGVQFAGSNARVATDVCGVDAGTVSKYKDSSKKKFAQDTNFEADWQLGWQKAQKTVTGYVEMKNRDPKEYETQKTAACAEMNLK